MIISIFSVSLVLFSLIPTGTVCAQFDSFSAEAYIVGDAYTGTIIAEKNADKRLAPASITKIMTLLLVCEALENDTYSLDTPVAISEKAANMGGSQLFLEPGEQRTVEELIYGIAVESGNDAAVALAEFTGGSYDNFIALMNAKAAELGMTNTNFVTPCGLDAENHYTSARDIFIMSQELIKYPDILKYTSTWMKDIVIGRQNNITRTLVNTNKLIGSDSGYIDGLKTGYTSPAGHCISLTGKKGDTRIIAVVLHSADSKTRFAEAKELLDYALNTYEGTYILKKNLTVAQVEIQNGDSDVCDVIVHDDCYIFGRKDDFAELSKEVILYEGLKAPLSADTQIGSIKIKYGDSVKEYALFLAKDIGKCSLLSYLKNISGILLP